jgi:hypothetical protein
MAFHRLTLTALVALLIVSSPAVPAAHDIPADVAIQVILKPDGQRLRAIVRAPLKAMRDVTFPTRGPGILDLSKAEPSLRHAASLWLGDGLQILEDDASLGPPRITAARISLPSDRSFASFDEAFAHVTGPALPVDTEIPWDQGLLDVLFEYSIRSPQSRFSIVPAFARLGVRVVTALRLVQPGGSIRAFEFAGDPGTVRLDPRWHQAAWRFVKGGFLHILDGTDHLLFLLCLVIPFRRLRPLVLIVTAFTAAHSITLIASAYGIAPDGLWFPPLVETLIAISIVYMALENIAIDSRGAGVERRWMIAFAFGLVHGFGFSFALRETLQFAGSHLLTSLLSFNIGVELGQLLVLAILVPALALLFRHVVAERMGTIILSALVAHTAWHWMEDRLDRLRQFAWPALDAATLAAAVRVAMVVVAAAGVVWFVSRILQERSAGSARAHE